VVDIADVIAVAVELTGATVTPVMVEAASEMGNVLPVVAAVLAFRVTVTG
jgi:hypothetical protein